MPLVFFLGAWERRTYDQGRDVRTGQKDLELSIVVMFGPKHYYTWAIHSLWACGSSWARGRSIVHCHGCSTAASNALVVSSTVADAGERVHSRDKTQTSNC